MAVIELTAGQEFLCNAARTYFKEHYGNPQMHLGSPLHEKLSWVPALRFVIQQHINIFVEPSETNPYPRILEMKNIDVRHFPQPIAIYIVCPEDVFLKPTHQAAIKRLQDHGFGLVTVDTDGVARRRFRARPLVQVISEESFRVEVRGLSGRIRQCVSEAFDDYEDQPVNGVKALSEVIEGLVKKAGEDAYKKKYLSKSVIRKGMAETLDAMHAAAQFKDVRAEIGGVRSYVKNYRNLGHHWPSSFRKSYTKFTNCRHAFLEGIKQIKLFREAMKKVNLSGNLPRN